MPHLQEAGFGKFLLIISPLAIAGGVVAYAKYDEEFRKTLVKKVPAVEPVLEMFIDDKNPFDDVQKKFNQYKTSVSSTFDSVSSSVSSVSSSVSSVSSTVSNVTSSVTSLFGSSEPKSELYKF